MIKENFLKLMLVSSIGIGTGVALAAQPITPEIPNATSSQTPATKIQNNVFATLDKDQDNKLSRSETVQWTDEQFKSADVNSDGYLSREESVAEPLVPQNE